MDKKIVLFIDGENVSPDYIDYIMDDVKQRGRLLSGRLFGDLKNMETWQEIATKYAFKLQYTPHLTKTKNTSDIHIVIDALEFMYRGVADVFCLASSDSDFTPLANKLRELGAEVIGYGEKDKSTQNYRNAFTEFKNIAIFDKENSEVEDTDEIKTVLANIIVEHGEGDRMNLAQVGTIMKRLRNDFDCRNYERSSLQKLMDDLGFKTETINTTVYVSLEYTEEDKIKAFLLTYFNSKSNSPMLPNIKQAIEKQFDNFNYKALGYDRFSTMLSRFGYKVKNNKISK